MHLHCINSESFSDNSSNNRIAQWREHCLYMATFHIEGSSPSTVTMENINLKKLKDERVKRIEERKKIIKSKKDRRLMKYSDNYNEMFHFFLKGYRSGILSFCGSCVDVKRNDNSEDGKFSFRMFDNGQFKGRVLESAHPNILKGVIVAKKSWGLFCKEWSDGIADGLFTKKEIIDEFENHKIKIPEVFLREFENRIHEFKLKKYEVYLNKNKIQ